MNFSVVVPVWNAEKTVETCLKSILEQKAGPDEIIVVDGGSADGTIEMVQKHLRPTDTLISEPDKGPYDAMNKGVARARGEIVAILNSDDFWMPGTCELVREAFTDNEGIVHGNLNYIREDGVSELIKPAPSMLNYLCLGLPAAHPATFIHKKVYEEVGSYDFVRYPMCADQDFLYRALESGYRFNYVGEVLTSMNAGGLSSHTCFTNEIDLMISRLCKPRRSYAKTLRFLLCYKDSYYCRGFDPIWFRDIVIAVLTLGGAPQRFFSSITMKMALRTRIRNTAKFISSKFK
jgi:glycosyltransferase involved in cell wall biosynthesis